MNIRTTLYFMCVCLLFVSCLAKSDVLREPNIIRINDILVYEDVAEKIFNDARSKNIDMFDANDQKVKLNTITKYTKDVEIIIKSKLMDEIAKLYNEAISNEDKEAIILARSKGNKILLYVNKKSKIITTLIMQ
jgi:UDP-glucose 6-dehydrogenase